MPHLTSDWGKKRFFLLLNVFNTAENKGLKKVNKITVYSSVVT